MHWRRKEAKSCFWLRIRLITPFLVCSVAATTLGCAAVKSEKGDTMCDALSDFAESIHSLETHEITLRTEWGAEPFVACGRSDKAPEIALCEYLVENTSIEFMTENVRRVLDCTGIDFPPSSEQIFVRNLAGTVVSRDPAFTDEPIEIVVSFDTAGDENMPSMTISISRRDDY